MTTSIATRDVQAASRAVFAVFVLSGVNFSSWAARLPAVRDALGLDAAQMGALLLVGAMGSVVALPLSGLVVTRLGARRTVLGFALLNACGLMLAAGGVALGQLVLVGVGLVLAGVGTGVWDASMNLEGAVVEQRLGRSVMSRYHAGFSIGTVGAAGVAAGASWLHVPVVVHLPIVLAVSSLVVLRAVRDFLPAGGEQLHGMDQDGVDRGRAASVAAGLVGDASATTGGATVSRYRLAFGAWLERRTLLIGLVVLAAALTEGAANDWVALAVVDGFGTDHTLGAIAFGLFVSAMTLMRFLGTGLLDRYGRVAVLRGCATLAIAGLVLFGLAPTDMLWLALVGAVLWGMGAAIGFPVGMSAASDDPRYAASRVSVVSTIGYTAFLAGPPLLGMLAQHVGYRHALLVIVIPVVVGLFAVKAAAPVPANLEE